MPRFSSKRRVHHTASQMFDLVADVERYPEFVPLCQSLRIREHCDVGFFLSYEFRSRMLAMLMGTMFDAAFQRFAAAFEKRADAVYGKGGAGPAKAG
jgi:ribosome-associated toxin RatA of RatAB toxin-antitoxin module